MNLCSLDDLTDAQLHRILDQAAEYGQGPGPHSQALSGRIVCTAFFEASTRTRLSFETATHRLGGDVVGFSEAKSTSSAKGESLEDTVRVLSGYADAIVIRHPEAGAAARAAAVGTVPIINAGDGAGEHPTQALIDLFTMRQHCGQLDGITVAVVGDLRFGRTVHSLVPALKRVGATVLAVPAQGLELPHHLADKADTTTLPDAIAASDVIYMTRVQAERLPADFHPSSIPRIAASDLVGSDAIVLHPLPRVDEIAPDVDALPAAKYFQQAANGVPVRMAILETLLETRS